MFPDTAAVADDIIMVLVDDQTLSEFPWPIPRQLYAQMLPMLEDWGALVVGFDIVFDTASRYSAREDSLLGANASEASCVMVMPLSDRVGEPLPPNALIDIEMPQDAGLDSARSCTPPWGAIGEGAELLSTTADVQDPDGVYRSVRLLTATPDGVVASLPLAMAYTGLGRPGIAFDGSILRLGERELELRRGARLQLRFRGPRFSYRSFPLTDLTAALNARHMGEPCPMDSAAFRDAYVLVGYSSPGLYDLKPTPYSRDCPGVEVLATALDNILHADYLRSRPAGWVLPVATIAISILAALALSTSRSIPVGALLALLPIALYAGSVLLAFRMGYWLEAVVPMASGGLTVLFAGLYLFGTESRRRREVKNAFSQYLSPDVVARVTEDPESLVLGGDSREMTVFFSDIRGFTGIAETMSPADLVALLNDYLTLMTDRILATGGTVDKFEGDAIIAFWGAPIHMPDHAARACEAALQCRDLQPALDGISAAGGLPRLVTRIGLSTGEMVVGNMGSSRRFDYTVMGSVVNLGSRLEGVNKVYGTRILVPSATAGAAGDSFVLCETDTVRVVGQRRPVTLFELVCRRGEETEGLPGRLKAYGKALELYRSGRFGEASSAFREVALHGGSPAAAAAMADRCGSMAAGPPPAAWDGVWNLTSK